MNLYFVLTLIFIFLKFFWSFQAKRDFIPLAISEIVKEYFVKNSMRFDFITDSEDYSWGLKDQLKDTIKLSSNAFRVSERSVKPCFFMTISNGQAAVECDFRFVHSRKNKTSIPTFDYLEKRQRQSTVMIFDLFSNYRNFDRKFRLRSEIITSRFVFTTYRWLRICESY